MKERDRQLAEEVNRVYWARYPNAPTELDETSPEWEQWRVSWNNIWQEVMDNAPEPEDRRETAPEGVTAVAGFRTTSSTSLHLSPAML